jgi:hypothetical protein
MVAQCVQQGGPGIERQVAGLAVNRQYRRNRGAGRRRGHSDFGGSGRAGRNGRRCEAGRTGSQQESASVHTIVGLHV